jgi:hypothetical protein
MGRTFSVDEIQMLEEERILLPPPSGLPGKRKISASFLKPPSSHGSISSSSSSSGSVASVSFKHHALDLNSNLEIPLTEESPEALEFFGFTIEAAQEIYDKFHRRPQDEPFADDLLEWAYARANSLNSPPLSNLQPNEALTRIGIKKSLRDGILDANFRHIFETQTLLYWVKDSLEINYWTLVGLQGRLKEHAAKGKAKKAKRGSISDVFPAVGSSSSEPTAIITLGSSSSSLPKAYVAVQEPPPLLDDHVVLYTGKAASPLVAGVQWVQDDGTLNMLALASSNFRDFNLDRAAWYFTPERETAETYRGYAARRHENSETWLIRIQVPTTFMNSLSIKNIWYGPEWREFVWHCRNTKQPPSNYDSFCNTGPGCAEVIRGSICSAISRKVMKIKKHQIHELMTEQEVVMKCGTQNAVQVAFVQKDVANRLGEQIKGKIHIEVTPRLLKQ